MAGSGVPNPFFANGMPQAVPTSIQLSAANPFAQVCGDEFLLMFFKRQLLKISTEKGVVAFLTGFL